MGLDRSIRYAMMNWDLPQDFFNRMQPVQVGDRVCVGTFKITKDDGQLQANTKPIPIVQGICLGGGRILIDASHIGFFKEEDVAADIEMAMADKTANISFLESVASLRAVKSETGMAEIEEIGKFKAYTWRLLAEHHIYEALKNFKNKNDYHFVTDTANGLRNFVRTGHGPTYTSMPQAFLGYAMYTLEGKRWDCTSRDWMLY